MPKDVGTAADSQYPDDAKDGRNSDEAEDKWHRMIPLVCRRYQRIGAQTRIRSGTRA